MDTDLLLDVLVLIGFNFLFADDLQRGQLSIQRVLHLVAVSKTSLSETQFFPIIFKLYFVAIGNSKVFTLKLFQFYRVKFVSIIYVLFNLIKKEAKRKHSGRIYIYLQFA